MATPSSIRDLPRIDKASIARQLHQNLVERAKIGPAEPGLDAFIPQLDGIATRLETHLNEKSGAKGARAAFAVQLEMADIQVDTYCRHIEGFLANEASRRAGVHVEAVRSLHALLFPRGRAFLRDQVPAQNEEVRKILSALRSPDFQGLLTAILFPFSWLNVLESAFQESEEAYDARRGAQGKGRTHVYLGKDAESACVDLLIRLRKYVEAQIPAGDIDAKAAARKLLAPLLDALARQKALARARATRRGTGDEGEEPSL